MNIRHLDTANISKYGYTKKKDIVTEEHPSLKIKNNYRTPLERESVSFKGVPSFLISKTKPIAFNSTMESIKKAIGDAAESQLEHILKSETMSQAAMVNYAKDIVNFKEKRPLYLFLEGIKYPFTKLPLQIVNSILKKMESMKIIKNKKWIEDLRNKPIFRTLKDDEKLNAFRGIIETANKYKYDTEEMRRSSLVHDAMKMFDPKTGNYNGVHERALTRIVTGFIPAFFLANDAYNLSRLCDDDAKAAEKEKKIRFNQETKRVLSNAYIQLITMGALSKYINRSKFSIVATTFLTVLLTETYSRISNGKRVHFLSPAEAKKLNEKQQKIDLAKNPKEAEKEHTNEHSQESQSAGVKTPSFKNAEIQPVKLNIAQNDKADTAFSGAFKDFAVGQDIKNAISLPSIEPQNKSEEKELKPLLSFGTIWKSCAAIIAAGFAIKGLRAIQISKIVEGKAKKIKPVDNFFTAVKKQFNKISNKITQKSHTINKSDFEELIAKMKKNGFVDIAQEYEKTVKRHQAVRAINGFKNEFIADMNKLGIENAQNLGKINKSAIFSENLKRFISILEKNEMNELASLVQDTMFKTGKLIDIEAKNGEALKRAYTIVSNKIKSMDSSNFAQSPVKRALDTSFFINEEDILIKQFSQMIKQLKGAGEQKADIAKKYTELLNKALQSDKYDLGQIDRKSKPFVKFVAAPLNFMWSTVTLPYRIVKMALQLGKPQNLPKIEDEIKAISRSYLKLSKKLKMNDDKFKHEFQENIMKSFNKLSMSGISNADLSNLAKLSGTAATIGFLVSDNYNMVMLKSNGENKKEAGIKAKERVVQETSRLFYQMLFIDLFNTTFSSTYHNSLLGAQVVNTASTLAGEYFNRTAIGMPVKPETRDQILTKEYENITSPGLKGKFFRFMTRLTGKKVLSQRDKPTKPASQK